MDPTSAVLITFGSILLMSSWIQLIIYSFGKDYVWGLTTLFVPVLSYIYGLWAWQDAKDAWKSGMIGAILLGFGLL